MKTQDWTPYFSGQSSTLETLWQTARYQSPWLKVTPQGIAIDWNTAQTLNPDSFPKSNGLDPLGTVQLLVPFIPWDMFRPERLHLKDQTNSAGVALGQMPLDQNQGVLWLPFIDKTRQFIEELKNKLISNEKHFRHKKFNGFFLLDNYERQLLELFHFPHLEYQLNLKMDFTYMSPWKFPYHSASNYRTKDQNGMEIFRLTTHQNRSLIDLTSRVSSRLIDRAHQSTSRVTPDPKDFATILPQLSECSRLHWKARVPTRTIETQLETLVNGELWKNGTLYNKIHGLITKLRSLAQVYENETQDTSLGTIVKSIESNFDKSSSKLAFQCHDFLSQAGYGTHYEVAQNINSQLTWLVTETPLLTLFYSGLFQLYEKDKSVPLIFGFSPLVMSIQSAAKLTGSTLFTEPTSCEIPGTASSLESSPKSPLESSLNTSIEASLEASKKNLKPFKTKDLPLDQYSGPQLWAKVNQA